MARHSSLCPWYSSVNEYMDVLPLRPPVLLPPNTPCVWLCPVWEPWLPELLFESLPMSKQATTAAVA